MNCASASTAALHTAWSWPLSAFQVAATTARVEHASTMPPRHCQCSSAMPASVATFDPATTHRPPSRAAANEADDDEDDEHEYNEDDSEDDDDDEDDEDDEDAEVGDIMAVSQLS